MDNSSDDDDVSQCALIPRIQHVRSLGTNELQRFLMEPPGVGMAIVYAFVNIKDGKVYVGKHSHATDGKSMWQSRAQKHFKPVQSVKTHWANAMRKYGKDSFECYIIWHGPESEVDKNERFWISPSGLHSIQDNGGWGYNHREGGEGGKNSKSAVEKIKTTMATAESRALRSAISKKQYKREQLLGMKSLKDRHREFIENETVEQNSERRRKISQSKSFDQRSGQSSALWRDDGYRKKVSAAIRTHRSTEMAKSKMSDQAKRQWSNPSSRKRMMNAMKKRSTKPYGDTMSASKRAISDAKNAELMKNMSHEEKLRFQEKIEKTRRATERFRQRLNSLRLVRGWEGAKYADVAKANKLGVVF